MAPEKAKGEYCVSSSKVMGANGRNRRRLGIVGVRAGQGKGVEKIAYTSASVSLSVCLSTCSSVQRGGGSGGGFRHPMYLFMEVGKRSNNLY